VTRDQARAELQIVADDLSREFTPETRLKIVAVQPGTLAAGDQRRLAQTFLSLLLGLVGLVLLIACANVGNLLLARVLGRRRELAIRVALGASRGQIARMLVTESLLVAGAGGAAGLLLSLWTTRAFAGITPLPTLSLRLDVHPDARVLGFTVLITLAAAAMLALVGAFQAPALKEDATASIGGRSPARLRATLATLQITVSLLLLIGAALFMRSVGEAAAIDLGFDTRNVLVMDIEGGGRTVAASPPFFRDVLQRVSALPGVEAAALSMRAPLDSSTPVLRVNAQEPVSAGSEVGSTAASLLIVSPRYFDVVKTPLVSGRGFTQQDDATRLAVAIVNETLAARLWPRGDAIGRRLWLDSLVTAAPVTVVGIARNSKYVTLGEEQQGHVYLPFAQQPRSGMALLVRSPNPPDRLANEVQAALRAVDPNVQGFFTRTLAEHVAVSMLPVRLAAGIAAAIAALALGLSVLGLYSLVSYLVAERTHEIGLRVALGASSADVLRLVLGYGLKLVLVGMAIGIPIALASSRLLGSLLYGVSPTDPGVFGMASSAVLAIAAVACYVPARRAMRMDPFAALRRV
jgi:predicted permease